MAVRDSECGVDLEAIVAIDSALNRGLVPVEVESICRRRRAGDACSGASIRRASRGSRPSHGSASAAESDCAPRCSIPGVGRVDLLIGDRLVLELDGRDVARPSGRVRTRPARDRALVAAGYRRASRSYAQVMDDWPRSRSRSCRWCGARALWRAATRRHGAKSARACDASCVIVDDAVRLRRARVVAVGVGSAASSGRSSKRPGGGVRVTVPAVTSTFGTIAATNGTSTSRSPVAMASRSCAGRWSTRATRADLDAVAQRAQADQLVVVPGVGLVGDLGLVVVDPEDRLDEGLGLAAVARRPRRTRRRAVVPAEFVQLEGLAVPRG